MVFAYLLLPGINDRSSDIRQLAKWFKGKNVMINVLQYNPTSNSKIRAPQKQEMVAFKHQLEQTGLEVTMRVSHGREIKAACGQLRQKNHLTQKELGIAVGFPDSCADVRIAQYEGDVRTPKEDLMKLFASTLGVPVELFTVPVLSEPREYEAAEYWRYELGAELD